MVVVNIRLEPHGASDVYNAFLSFFSSLCTLIMPSNGPVEFQFYGCCFSCTCSHKSKWHPYVSESIVESQKEKYSAFPAAHFLNGEPIDQTATVSVFPTKSGEKRHTWLLFFAYIKMLTYKLVHPAAQIPVMKGQRMQGAQIVACLCS